jgi:TPR repeat protein
MRVALPILAILWSLFLLGRASQDTDAASAHDFSALLRRAQAGNAEAQRLVGMAYEEGRGVKQDAIQAVEWYRKAAEQGDAAAQNNLGVMYRLGNGVPKDLNLAVHWYQKSAAQQFPAGLFNLGISYYNGDGLPIDPASAYAWLELASEAGSEPAKTALSKIGAEILECDKLQHLPESLLDMNRVWYCLRTCKKQLSGISELQKPAIHLLRPN